MVLERSPVVEKVNITAEQTTTEGTNKDTSVTIGVEEDLNVTDTILTGELKETIEKEIEEMDATENNLEVEVTNEAEEEGAGNDAEVQENVSAKDSTSSALSDKELSELRTKNPLAALKFLLSLSASSSNLAASSSTTSLTSINQESTEQCCN